MASSVPVQQGGVVVVTQMYPTPAQSGVVCNPIPQQMCTGTSTLSRVRPLALGTVQIMIGVTVFLFGVAAAVGADTLAGNSGSFVWGAGFYITAGSLTVAAGKSSNRCLMNTTLAFNVIATVAASSGIILNVLDGAVIIFCYSYRFLGSFDCDECFKYESRMQGLGGVLAVFHFFEFIISIVVSVFICKSTCSCCNEHPPVYIVPGNASVDPQAPPSYSASASVVQLPRQMMNVTNPAAGQSSLGLSDPPQYSEEMKSF